MSKDMWNLQNHQLKNLIPNVPLLILSFNNHFNQFISQIQVNIQSASEKGIPSDVCCCIIYLDSLVWF